MELNYYTSVFEALYAYDEWRGKILLSPIWGMCSALIPRIINSERRSPILQITLVAVPALWMPLTVKACKWIAYIWYPPAHLIILTMWLLLILIYVAPPDAIDWLGSWKLEITRLMEQYCETEKACPRGGEDLKAKLNQWMLAPFVLLHTIAWWATSSDR